MPIYKMTDKNGKNIKKDGLQKYRVRINYIDNYGKPKQIDRVAYGAEQAKQLESELNYKIKHEKPSGKITVEGLYNEYICSKQYEVRETTLEKTKRLLQRYVLAELGEVKISKLTVPILQEWKLSIEQHGFETSTKKCIYDEFRALLNYGVKMEYISVNPLLKLGNFKTPLEIKEEMQFYTIDEFKKFIQAAKDFCTQKEKDGSLFEWNYYVFFCIAFYTGMRKGEINALLWADICGNEIKITKSLVQHLKGADRITPPKNTSSIRTIQIPTPLREVLKEHYDRCSGLFSNFSDDFNICGGRTPLRNTSISRMNELFAQKAGVKKIRIHDFRHSHASLLANEGINIQEIARRLGHSDISMTLKTYSHLYPSESERALAVLDKIQIENNKIV